MIQGSYNWNNPTMQPTQPVIVQPTQPQMPMEQQYPMNLQGMNQAKPQIYYIPGRSVSSPDEPKAYEVPMDSPLSIFPNVNGAEIYVKYWGANGAIETDVYVKVDKTKLQTNDQNGWESVQRQLNRIESILKNRKNGNRKSRNNNYEGGEKNSSV